MPSLFKSHLRRYWPVGLVLILGAAGSGGVGWALHRQAVELDRKRVALRMEEVADQLDGRIEKTEMLALHLQDYLTISGETRDQVLNAWCTKHGLLWNFPWIHGIAVATNHHIEWRQQLPGSPRTWKEEDWQTLHNLASQHPIECRVAFESNVKDRKRFLADYALTGRLEDTNRFSAAIKGGVRMSSRRTVMLNRKDEPLIGTLLFAPVYDSALSDLVEVLRPGATERIEIARWLHLNSMIVLPIDFRALIDAVWDGKPSDLGVELFCSTNQTEESWLNVSGSGPRAADPRFKAYLTHRADWPMFGKHFSIFFYTTPLFEAHSPRRLAKATLGAGMGITLLATALVGVSLRARDRQEKMTANIMEARDALAAAEKEREKLGHDLHDGAIQSLYAAQLGLTRTAEDVAASVPSAARVLSETRAQLDEVIAELRRYILAREADEHLSATPGLDSVLGSMVERLQSTTSTELKLHAEPGAADGLSVAQVVQLTQIVRTAGGNSLRHAQARHVDIALRRADGVMQLEIVDDGVGFDINLPTNGGMGLRTMRARASEAGGTINVDSCRDAGTSIIVTIPVGVPVKPEAR